ncbi:MAG: glycosyltransferase family 39 protein, partial [Herpetosiphonaceae bacterium]|nr:glycosyltransferase family 39 protein [Herpetosiphonaceae bacterium]
MKRDVLALPPHALGMTACLFVLSLGLLLVSARVAARSLRFVVGDRVSDRMLVNFYGVQQNSAERYRWSQATSQLVLYGYDGQPASVSLHLSAARPAGVAPGNLALQDRQHELVHFPITTGWRHYQLLIPTAPVGNTPLRLESSYVRPGLHDSRNVGVAIEGGVITPADASGWFLSLQRATLFLMLPLLVWLLLWRVGAPALAAGAGGIACVCAVAMAAIDPLDASYLLPSTGWPWWALLSLLMLVALPVLSRWSRMRATWVRRTFPFAPWIGSILAFSALVSIRLGLNVALGLTGLCCGTIIVLASMSAAPEAVPLPKLKDARGMRWPRFEAASLVMLVLIAMLLRLYRLDTQPLGLWRDEARHGLLALRIWQDPTFRPVYVVEGADLPALLFYLMAPVVGIFGPHLWSVRLVSALAGSLAPLALWWAIRPLVGARAALYAAALLAWTSWSLSMSRWAFPVTLDQLFVLLAIGCMWRALAPLPKQSEPQPSRRKILAGRWWPILGMSLAALCAGLATYTYHTGRLAPVILAMLTALRLGRKREEWRRSVPALVAALIIGTLVTLPLVRFVLSDYDGFTRRTARVAIANSTTTNGDSPLVLLARNAERYMLMWHVQGELNGRHHAPGVPMLDPFAGLLLLLGLGVVVMYRRHSALVFVSWIALALVPGLFSTGAPHAMRSFGALAPGCALVGLGLAAFCQTVGGRTNQRVVQVLPYTVGLASLLFNGWLYFTNMAHNPAVYDQFDVDTTAMARVAMAASSSPDAALRGVQVFLPVAAGNDEVTRFLLSGSSVGWVDGSQLSRAA